GSRARGSSRSSRPDLLLVAPHGRERRALAAQLVVEQLPPLGLAQLRREEGADVGRAVEVHVADDVPRDALVDGDVAVCLRADEVRAPEAPDDEPGGADEQGEGKSRPEQAPAWAARLAST